MIPGRARPANRTTAASAAHRSRAASATSQSPWTVSERTRLRPLTGSAPNETRTSHTPDRRSRNDPPPRTGVMVDGRNGVALYVDRASDRRPNSCWDACWDVIFD